MRWSWRSPRRPWPRWRRRRARSDAAGSWCTARDSARWRSAWSTSGSSARRSERHSLPVCGPNGNGIVAVPSGAAMWGDALRSLEPGPVALVSQSGNVAVNALATRRALRFHTVVSCGNSVAVDPAEWVTALAQDEDVRSIALYLEADGDGALLCDALGECAERGVRVAVLKVGASAAGAAAALAHTGAVAGDQRVFKALVEEAGAAWAEDVHDLLELAKALAVPQSATGPGGLRPRRPHLLRRRLGSRGRRVRPAGHLAAAPGRGGGRAAPRAASRRGHGGEPARLHGADLGRRRAAPRHRGGGRRGPRRRPRPRPLRPGRRQRPGRVLAGRPRGHPGGGGALRRAGDGRLHPPRAARRASRAHLHRGRHPGHRRPAHRPRLRGRARHRARRAGAAARDRISGAHESAPPPRPRATAPAGLPSTRPRSCSAKAGFRSSTGGSSRMRRTR